MSDEFSLFTSLRHDPRLREVPRKGLTGVGWNFENESSLYMLDFHRDRMLKAAAHWKWQPAVDVLDGGDGLQNLSRLIQDVVGPCLTNPLRLRIVVSREGEIKVQKFDTSELPLENLLPTRLPPPGSSLVQGDPKREYQFTLLVDRAETSRSEYTHYKTTKRAMYDSARERAKISPIDLKEALVINRDDGSVMEGTITTPYFWRNDQWVTPPVATKFSWDSGSGGQDGTSRRWALARSVTLYLRDSGSADAKQGPNTFTGLPVASFFYSENMESMIQEGRQHYVQKRFRPALEQFTRAMKLCPCTRGIKRERCTCKNFEKVALEGGSIFKEAMYNCKCSVGKTFNKCDNYLHVQALDYRAATFEAIPDLGRAQKDAEWILELAPRLLDGYLRLGKIARLLKKYEFAWTVYNAGIEVGQQLGNPTNAKMKALHTLRQPLHLRYSRRDPLKNPQEIVQRFFHFMDLATLVYVSGNPEPDPPWLTGITTRRCLRVSKDWKQYLTSRGNERLWRSLIFKQQPSNRPAPRAESLKKLVSYSGNDVRDLAIEDVLRFGLTQSKFIVLLKGSRHMRTLTLHGSTDAKIEMPERPGVFTELTHVHMVEFLALHINFLGPLLRNVSESLQSLHLAGLPQFGSRTSLDFPTLPMLKILRLEEHERPYPLRLELFEFVSKTPQLQQLWLSDVQLGSTDLSHDQIDTAWGDLKTVVVKKNGRLDTETADNFRRLISIQRGKTLQYIDLDFTWRLDRYGPLEFKLPRTMPNQQPAEDSANEFTHINYYEDLRSLRLSRNTGSPANLQEIISPALAAGKLHTLDIVFPLDDHGMREGAASSQHLQDYAWLRSASSIRNLGLFEFRFRSNPRDDLDMMLPDFLASFPNLEVIELDSSFYVDGEFASFVKAILRATKLRKIYQRTVHGVMLDQLTALAAKSGVQMVWGQRECQWPAPLEE
ncbi:hypothetical protein AK830_g3459 [Neonectria ditissima]|uniref:Uncharacterized protein n=1 Tax=Neonectria ditissima TaxID=78410 RepID=A0A0P7BHY4_9HYPO|nr:hypothetical protein AK830_g3459 [Neonectria ditissima]